MDLLKQKNWWIWLLIFLVGNNISAVILASMLDLYEKDAWYTKWYYWVIAACCCLFPFIIMFSVFALQSLCMVAKKLSVPGEEIYASPYSWLLCLIVPILGWTLLGIMVLYLDIWCIISLYRGNGEKFIK